MPDSKSTPAISQVVTSASGLVSEPRPKKLLDQVHDAIKRKHYSPRTEESYANWIKRFILFHGIRHPNEMGAAEVEAFLTHLAVEGHVAASTQNQALSALLFLYREVLHKDLEVHFALLRAEKARHLPTVLSKEETRKVLAQMTGVTGLMARLLYGCGLRLQECVELRVKDIDFDQRQIMVRDGKGMEDRVTILPDSLIEPLKAQLLRVKKLHEQDLAHGQGAAPLPFALARKYPNADREWGWQYVFPSARLALDAETGEMRRWYMSPSTLQKAVRQAAKAAGIAKPVGPHTFRHSFATHLLENHYDYPHSAGIPGPQGCAARR